MPGLLLVGAAALLLAGAHREGRSTARAWAFVGAALWVATNAAYSWGSSGPTKLVADANAVASFWRDVVWRGGAPADGGSPWAQEIP